MQAAVLHLKLRNLKELNQKRKQIAGWYHESLKNLEIGIVPQKYLEYSSWHLYPVRLFNRDQKYALQYFLKTKDIPSSLFYERSLPEEKPLLDIEGETKNEVVNIGIAHRPLHLDARASPKNIAERKFLSL